MKTSMPKQVVMTVPSAVATMKANGTCSNCLWKRLR
jgi:hypothetical protein